MEFKIQDGVLQSCIPYMGESEAVIPEGVTSIGKEAFLECRELQSIIIPESVTSIGEKAFSYCSSLRSITIPESVTEIGAKAFFWCRRLQSITIPESIRRIAQGLFIGCEALRHIRLPEQLESIEKEAFDCSGIESITIPKRIQTIEKATFLNCRLQSIIIPENVTRIRWAAFYECKSLESITIPETLRSIDYGAFANCEKLHRISVAPDHPFFTADADVLFDKKQERLIMYPCGKQETHCRIPDGVKKIGDMAFYECKKLQSVTIPESVTSIGAEAFAFCSSLRSIIIPDSVMRIGKEAFDWCESLQSIVFRGFVIPAEQYNPNLLHKDMPKLREMLRTEDYATDIPAAVKIPVLLTEYRKHQSPKPADWIRQNALEVLRFLIDCGDAAAAAAVLQIENLPLPRQEVEKAVVLANGGNPEIQMLLMQYLETHSPCGE